jgi:hypothetical protein
MMPVRAQLVSIGLAAVVSSALTLGVAQVLAPSPGQAAPESQAAVPLVRAQRIELVDENGVVRAMLSTGAGDESAGISFRDAQGRERAGMGTGRPGWGTGAGAYVLDANGRLRAAWGLAPQDAGAGFLVFDETTTRRVGLGGGSAGYGVVVADESGQFRVGMGPLRDEEGYGFSVRDRAGDRRALMGADVDGASLAVFDAAGRPIWQAP